MQATRHKIIKRARELGGKKHVTKNVYSKSYFTKKHTVSRTKMQGE